MLSPLNDNKNIGIMEFVPAKERKQIYREIEQTGITENDKTIHLKKGFLAMVSLETEPVRGRTKDTFICTMDKLIMC